MLKNYITTSIRNFLKNKSYTIINISGLAVGIACCVLIMAYVQQELEYDQFHINNKQIYRFVTDLEVSNNIIKSGHTPAPAGPALLDDFAEIERTVRFLKPWMGDPVIKMGENVFPESGFLFADPDVFKIFSFEVIDGDPYTALNAPNTIAITQEMATKYFGKQDPMGKTLTVDSDTELIVTALLKNVPDNSHIQFDFLASMATMQTSFPQLFDMWNSTLFNTYTLLSEGYNTNELIKQMDQFTEKYVANSKNRMSFTFEPLSDIYLYSERSSSISQSGDIMYVYIFTAIAVFILLIACINFMNLSTARSSKRAVEIGVRKVLGADKQMLIFQFLSESVLMAVLSLGLSLLFIEILQPVFSQLSGTHIDISYFDNITIFSGIIGITLFVGFAAGSYPAFVMSRFKTLSMFRENRISISSEGSWLRKTFVILQFSISITLIICTLVVYTQLDFMLSKDLGFNKEQIITISSGSGFVRDRFEAFREELLSNSDIHNVTASMNLPGMGTYGFDYRVEGRPADDVANFSSYLVDVNFIDTYQMEIIKGRKFSRDFTTDATEAVIINETAAKHLGWDDQPLNKKIDWLQPSGAGYTTLREGKVIAVVKDFHSSNLHFPIGPVILQMWGPSQFNVISVKLNSQNARETMKFIEQTWGDFNSDGLFNPNFLDEQFAAAYEAEEQFGSVFIYFAGLAIIIACLGLFGLASFMAEQRTKEIGIRKVHGAGVSNIISLLTREFVKLVLIANLLAWPLAYYSMQSWLDNFAFKIEIAWWLFALSGLTALTIALLTVSSQAIKVAVANPITALRYE